MNFTQYGIKFVIFRYMEKNSLGKAGSAPFLFDALTGKSLF